MLFHALSPVIICLWSLLVAIGPIYTIPALISPVLTPLLSPADGPTILILTEVCDAAVPITFPVCDPSGAPVPPSGSPEVLSSRRASQLVASILISGYAGVVLCTKGTTRSVDGVGSITSVPSHLPAQATLTSLPLPPFPPPSGKAGSVSDLTPLSQTGVSGSLRCQVSTRPKAVGMSGRSFQPSPADSGYGGSRLLSRSAASKRRQSRLRFVTSADVGSPVPPGCVVANDQCPTVAAILSTTPGQYIYNPTGFPPVSGITTPSSVKRKGVSGREGALEARDALLRLRAAQGHAAPSRLCCSSVNERSASAVTRSPNIQALNDILESSKARLRKIREIRSAWDSPPNTRSCSLTGSSNVEEEVSWTDHILPAPSPVSPESPQSLRQGPIRLEECKTTLDRPADLAMFVGEEPPSYPVPPFEAPFADSHSRKGTSGTSEAKALDYPPSTSMDVGLRLLQQAICERGGRSWDMEQSQASYEASVSINLGLAQGSSFLDDIFGLFVHDSLQLAEVRNEQVIRPTPPISTLPITAPPSNTPKSVNDSIASKTSPLALQQNQTPSPPAPSLGTSVSLGRSDASPGDFFHWFSRPTVTSRDHDTHELPSCFPLDDLELAEDITRLMGQSAPPSPIEPLTRPGSPIPPFEVLISRVYSRNAATAIQQDQVSPSARGPEIPSSGRPGRLEISISLGRIADILHDIWAPPAHKFSDGACIKAGQHTNPSVPSASIGSSFGPPTTSVPSFKDVVQDLPSSPDVFSKLNSSRLLDLSLPGFSDSSGASPVSSPGSCSSGDGFRMEIPESTPLCRVSLVDLADGDCSF